MCAPGSGRVHPSIRPGSSSYLSCNEEQLLIGIGPHESAERVRIDWPGGESETWDDVPAGKTVWLQEGRGRMHTGTELNLQILQALAELILSSHPLSLPDWAAHKFTNSS